MRIERSDQRRPARTACRLHVVLRQVRRPRLHLGSSRMTVWLAVIGLLAGSAPLWAGEVRLMNGMRFEGDLMPIRALAVEHDPTVAGVSTPILMIDTGMQKYYVPARQIPKGAVKNEADLSRFEEFTLQQRPVGRRLTLTNVGEVVHTRPFDEFGRRTVTVATGDGPIDVIQGITKLSPRYVTVTSLNYYWEYGVSPASVGDDRLAAILHSASDPTSPKDRMAVARYFVQAGRYQAASNELDSIKTDFPDMQAAVEQVLQSLRTLWAEELLGDLRMRQSAGQHQLVRRAIRVFPVANMPAGVLRELHELASGYEQAEEKLAEAKATLGRLQAELADHPDLAAIKQARYTINDELTFDTLGRLDAFFAFANDPDLPAAERMATALSGWLVGSAQAKTELSAALALWEARELVQASLRTIDANEKIAIVTRLATLEGIDATTLKNMIPLLPPAIELGRFLPGEPAEVQVGEPNAQPAVRYTVSLPPEYSPQHPYPMIVAMRSAGQNCTQAVRWWAGDVNTPGMAQHHGYIVIAPEYLPPDRKSYSSDGSVQNIVTECIRDARRRFQVDSDRIFLAGHGMGGDAAFDVGMSQPDVFAGVIPITGISDNHCMYYWGNAEQTAWYVVNGDRDRDTKERNSRELNRMMKYGFDLIYTVYTARGYESYYEELDKLFEWMSLQRRSKPLDEFKESILRPSENEFFWVLMGGFPDNVTQPIVWSGGGRLPKISPMQLKADIKAGSPLRTVIYVRSGARNHSLLLFDGLIDFGRRLRVEINGRQVFHEVPQPNMQHMLDDLQRRGDRQRLVNLRLDFN